MATARHDQVQAVYVDGKRVPAHLQLPSGLNETPASLNLVRQVPKLNGFPEPEQLVSEANTVAGAAFVDKELHGMSLRLTTWKASITLLKPSLTVEPINSCRESRQSGISRAPCLRSPHKNGFDMSGPTYSGDRDDRRPVTLNGASWSLLLATARVEVLRLVHLLLRGVGRGDLGHGRVLATLRSDVEIRHHPVHRATDDVAGVHGAGGWLVHPLNVAGE